MIIVYTAYEKSQNGYIDLEKKKKKVKITTNSFRDAGRVETFKKNKFENLTSARKNPLRKSRQRRRRRHNHSAGERARRHERDADGGRTSAYCVAVGWRRVEGSPARRCRGRAIGSGVYGKERKKKR